MRRLKLSAGQQQLLELPDLRLLEVNLLCALDVQN